MNWKPSRRWLSIMTTSIDRKALDRAKGLIVTASGAMRNVTASLAGVDHQEGFKALHDAALLEANLPELSVALEEAFTFLAESWEEIRDNEVRLYEVFLFISEYRKFAETVDAFDDMINSCIYAPRLFSDATIGNEYYLLASKYEQLLQPVLSVTDGKYGQKNGSRFAGLADALHAYIRNAEDSVLEGIITGTNLPEHKLRWTGPLNEATLFGQHFGLSCKWMNDCFEFRSKDRRAQRLHYSSNRLNNDVKEYPISEILVKFSQTK